MSISPKQSTTITNSSTDTETTSIEIETSHSDFSHASTPNVLGERTSDHKMRSTLQQHHNDTSTNEESSAYPTSTENTESSTVETNISSTKLSHLSTRNVLGSNTLPQPLEELKNIQKHNIAVFGEGSVGKSTLIARFVSGHFITGYDPTVEDYFRKLEIIDDEPYVLNILDTAGQEQYYDDFMHDAYMQQNDAFVIVYSITSRRSFNEAMIFREKILRAKECDDAPIILVGNKCDLENQREVQTGEAKQLALDWGEYARFIETSAKEEINNRKCFHETVQLIIQYNNDQSLIGEYNNDQGKGPFCVVL